MNLEHRICLLQGRISILLFYSYYPPASEVTREGANLTERKNLHTPVYGVKEFVCLSVHL